MIALLKLLKPFLPYIFGTLAAILVVSWFSHARYSAGEAAGRKAVQAEWAEAQAAADDALAAAIDNAAKVVAEQVRKTKEIQDGLQAKLDHSADDARNLSEQLRRYQARRCASTLPATAGATGVAAPASGVAEDSGAVAEATDAYFAACARDAVKVDGWLNWCRAIGLPGC